MEGTPSIDSIITTPHRSEQDPEMEKILKELNDEIAKLAKPISPIKKRTLPVLNHRYPTKRGDWQLFTPDIQVREVESKVKPRGNQKVRIRPYAGTFNNVLLNTVTSSSPNQEKRPAKPRIRHTRTLENRTVLKIRATTTTTPSQNTATTTSTVTSATTTSTVGTATSRPIPVITLGDDLPPGFTPPPRIPEPVMETMLSMSAPTTGIAKTTCTTAATSAIQVGKKKRKRHSRNKRHGLRYVRDGETLY